MMQGIFVSNIQAIYKHHKFLYPGLRYIYCLYIVFATCGTLELVMLIHCDDPKLYFLICYL